jgi:hypothetical protein
MPSLSSVDGQQIVYRYTVYGFTLQILQRDFEMPYQYILSPPAQAVGSQSTLAQTVGINISLVNTVSVTESVCTFQQGPYFDAWF